jgi:hypothetical protein
VLEVFRWTRYSAQLVLPSGPVRVRRRLLSAVNGAIFRSENKSRTGPPQSSLGFPAVYSPMSCMLTPHGSFSNLPEFDYLSNFPMLWWIITVITIMSSIVVSQNTELVFGVEGITDVAQSTATVPYHNDSDDSILIFEVQSNHPTRYSITPAFGVVHNNQTCIVAAELVSSDMGLVRFLSSSGHPFVSQSDIKAYIDCQQKLDNSLQYLMFNRSLNG